MKNIFFLLTIILLLSCKGSSDKETIVSDTLQPSHATFAGVSDVIVDTLTDDSPNTTLTLEVPHEKQVISEDFTYSKKNNSETEIHSTNISRLYSQFVLPAKIFSINPYQDTVVIGEQGTKITIAANSFIFKDTGRPVMGEVQLFIKEYYKLSDMLLANLTTTSNGEILETGGMIYLEAKSNGKDVGLKEDASIVLEFPSKENDEDMLLWHGGWNENVIDWQMAAEIPDTANTIYEISDLDEPAEFPGGTNKLVEYFMENLRFPSDAREAGIQGTVFVEFVINQEGKIDDARILRGIHPTIDREAMRVIEEMPIWIPGKKNGQPVSTKYALPIRFWLDAEFQTNDESYAQNFESTVSDENVHSVTRSEILGYVFSTSKLGWINVDKLIRNRNSRIYFEVDLKNDSNTDVKLILRDYNSILPMYEMRNKYGIQSVPTNLFAKILGIKFENDKYYIATQDIQIRQGFSPRLEFTEVTTERLKEIMEEINAY